MGLHLGRGLCPGRDLYRDPDPGRRSGPLRPDLPEVLEVLLAQLLEWWSSRQPTATARTNPQLMISSFSLPLASLGQIVPTAHKQNRTGSAQLEAVPIRTVSKRVET